MQMLRGSVYPSASSRLGREGENAQHEILIFAFNISKRNFQICAFFPPC